MQRSTSNPHQAHTPPPPYESPPTSGATSRDPPTAAQVEEALRRLTLRAQANELLKAFGLDLNVILVVAVILFFWLVVGIASVFSALTSIYLDRTDEGPPLWVALTVLFANPLVIPTIVMKLLPWWFGFWLSALSNFLRIDA